MRDEENHDHVNYHECNDDIEDLKKIVSISNIMMKKRMSFR